MGQLQKILLSISVLMLCLIPISIAEDVEIIMDRNITLSDNNSGIFKISNLDHVSGLDSNILVDLTWNFTSNSSLTNSSCVSFHNISFILNKYSRRGWVFIGSSDYILCANVSVNVSDNNSENDHVCLYSGTFQDDSKDDSIVTDGSSNVSNISVSNTTDSSNWIGPSNDTNNLSDINLTNSSLNQYSCDHFSINSSHTIVDSKEKIYYNFLGMQRGDEVTYWIEDLYGNIIKKQVTTKQTSKRTYTPKTDLAERAIVIKAVRRRAGCEEVSSEHLLVVVGDMDDLDKGSLEDSITILDRTTQEATYGEKINIYLRITKADNRKRIILLKFDDETFWKMSLKNGGVYEFTMLWTVPMTICSFGESWSSISCEGLGTSDEQPIHLLPSIDCKGECDTSLPKPSSSKIIPSKNTIRSFYTLSKNYRDKIRLFGSINEPNITAPSRLWLLTLHDPIDISRDDGKFIIDYSPKKGNNSVVLLLNSSGRFSVKKLDFYLDYDGVDEVSSDDSIVAGSSKNAPEDYSVENDTPFKGSFIFDPPIKRSVPTARVVYDDGSDKDLYLLSLMIIGSLLLVSVVSIKRKHLRTTTHSKKEPWLRINFQRKRSRKRLRTKATSGL